MLIKKTKSEEFFKISEIVLIRIRVAYLSYREQKMVARGKEYRLGEMGEGGQNVQTSSYIINKSWGADV